MISDDDLEFLRELYGEHADVAASEILYWLQHGYLPALTVFIHSVEYARDGSLIFVHKGSDD